MASEVGGPNRASSSGAGGRLADFHDLFQFPILLGELVERLGAPRLAAAARLAASRVGEEVEIEGEEALYCHAVELRVLEDRPVYVVGCRAAPTRECSDDATLRGVRDNVAAALALLQRRALRAPESTPPPTRPLTTIEQKVFGALIAGYRVPTIARDLHVSEGTVRSHLRAIFAKHEVHSQAELFEKVIAHRTGRDADETDG